MHNVIWEGPQLFLASHRKVFRRGREILDRRIARGDTVTLSPEEFEQHAGSVREVVVPAGKAEEEAPGPLPAPPAPEEDSRKGEEVDATLTVVSEAEAEETVEEEAGPEEWPKRMPPETYLRLYPEGEWAELAGKVLQAQQQTGEA